MGAAVTLVLLTTNADRRPSRKRLRFVDKAGRPIVPRAKSLPRHAASFYQQLYTTVAGFVDLWKQNEPNSTYLR